ncbi:MAG: squalene--hopene cyclase [Planctomycetales bacterium]|nr:squalene--hopene cyclase [Planctomycetales bacterium]
MRAHRTPSGHWEGELSSSALSTATAVCALQALAASDARLSSSRRAQIVSLVEAGLHWLVDCQNSDGGFGDTTLSLSNISTTSLCWSALATPVGGPLNERVAEASANVEAWLAHTAGSLEPTALAAAIRRRYGKDHTFSVPILTTLALHGKLGSGSEAWRLIPQLPFELAACPPSWYAALRLPVVSYALPALIAIGLVRHAQAPSRNPLLSRLREALRKRVLAVLRRIQPPGGGFLEATPLTSFVTLGLVGAGAADDPVVDDAASFLIASARPDGSWPIDTNLATWTTTLAVNALAAGDGHAEFIASDNAAHIRQWLLDQQYRDVHPYTQAKPGGWAWTDLPGGVPDADDTPGALLALASLGGPPGSESRLHDAARAGVQWLLDLQNRDGGMPTFCRGWGTLPFDRSSCDITAHGLRSWLAWRHVLSPRLAARLAAAQDKAWSYLARSQRRDGAWPPLWFGNQYAVDVDESNLTYGTSRVLLALAAYANEGAFGERSGRPGPDAVLAIQWLLGVQGDDGGWGGAAGVPSSVEETALAVEALAASTHFTTGDDVARAIAKGVGWLLERTSDGRTFSPSPIGFYFAKLWYYEKLYPLTFTLAALGRVDVNFDAIFGRIAVPPHADHAEP